MGLFGAHFLMLKKSALEAGCTVKKSWNLLLVAALCVSVLCGCSQKESDPTEGNSVSTTETAVAVSAHMEELTIQAGNREIYGRLFFPGMRTDEKRPLVILSHGYNGSHADFLAECRYFIDQGYLAFAFDFCGGSARSRSSGKSTDMTIFTEKDDLLAVIDYLSTLEQVDHYLGLHMKVLEVRRVPGLQAFASPA